MVGTGNLYLSIGKENKGSHFNNVWELWLSVGAGDMKKTLSHPEITTEII